VGVHVGQIALCDNFHVVVAGRVYRAAQMNPADLESAIRKHGIRTVINLRGNCDPEDWFLNEGRVTHSLGVCMEDVNFAAGRLPSVTELRHLVHALDRTEYPILIHCRQGADRTGMVSALILLLYTDTDLATAIGQLGIRFGHLSAGRTWSMDEFLLLYQDWLAAHQLPHAPAAFRRWLEHDYCAGACRCRIEVLSLPCQVPCDKPWLAHVRVHNRSGVTWRFSPDSGAGIHLGYAINDAEQQYRTQGRAGLFRTDVAPGQCVELDVALPPIAKPGRFRLVLDMVDEQHGWFYQLGSALVEREFEVYEP